MPQTRAQALRSSISNQRPIGRDPGELYVNFPDRQIGFLDPARLHQDLVAIRFFSAAATYAQHDYVLESGRLWRAVAAISAGPFDQAQWSPVHTGYVLISDAPPVQSPVPGTLWWESDSASLFIWYQDVDGGDAWVQVNTNGPPGTDGSSGTSMLNGSGVPDPALGNDGDSYYDIDTGDLYVKADGVWTLSGNIYGTTPAEVEADADRAETAADQAEAARDASFALGPKYATEALGRAAVADGAVFLVQGSEWTAAFEYRRTNATTSVLIATYPAKALVEEVTGPTIQTIGRIGGALTSTGGNSLDYTHIFTLPVLRAGTLKRIRFYGSAGLTQVETKVFRNTGVANVLTQVAVIPITTSAGLHEYSADAAEFTAVNVLAGDYIGWYAIGGRVTVNGSQVPPNSHMIWQAGAGNLTSWTAGGAPLAYIDSSTFNFGADIVTADLMTRDDMERIDSRTRQLGYDAIQTLGRPAATPPVNGIDSSNATFCFVDPVREDGYVTGIRVWSRGAGNVDLYAYSENGTILQASQRAVTIALADGLNTFSSAAGHFAPFPIRKGQHLGWFMGARLATTTGTVGDSGGLYNMGSPTKAVGNKGTPFTANRVEIGFDITYFNVTAAKLETMTQATYDAIVTKDNNTLYCIV